MLLRYCFVRKQILPLKSVLMMQPKPFKNFGHKRQPVAGVTVLWHGFLTFTFIGLGLNWNFLTSLMFGNEEYNKLDGSADDLNSKE